MREYARAVWEQPVRGLFFLNATNAVPMSFVQALSALEFQPVLLSGPSDVKVVDTAIQRTLGAAAAPAWETLSSPARNSLAAPGRSEPGYVS